MNRSLIRALSLALWALPSLHAVDKNGVAPSAISLPSGPGSIQGLGESFQPQLNSGSGSYQVPIVVPKGSGGASPGMALVYNSGGGNGSLGLGWSLSGAASIRRNTDHGVPRYVDGPNGTDDDLDAQIDNPEELDTYSGINGEELVPLADGSFRAENETGFVRYKRSGAGWEARTPEGARMLFGLSPATRIEEGGRVAAWCLERQLDNNGNVIDYEYIEDPVTPAQKYLRRVRWGQAIAFFGVVLSYAEGRPDSTVSYQTGLELRTTLRLVELEVFSQGVPAAAFAERGDFDGDGKIDALIRRYRLEYDANSHLSLLSRVTLLGADGVTAMPTLTLGYSKWTPADNVAANQIRSRGAPVEGFDSGSAELIDMNGDGLPDILSTSGNQHRVTLNRGMDAEGKLAWAPSRPVGNAPTIDISSDRTHLADATADGLSDLMVKVSNTSFLCFDNTSQNAWTSAPFPVRNTDTWPIWPYDGDGGKLSRSFDADYSRTNDILHTSNTGCQLWLFLPGGQYSREIRLPPIVHEGQTFRFDLPGTHIADLNGDRLQDLAWIQASRIVYFPSRGRGVFANPVVLNLGRTLSAAEIERADFSDVDGDGLVDVTLVRPAFEPNGVVYWLNRFQNGLEPARTVRGLPALRSGDALRWADLNGNGTTDIAISQAQSAPGEKILLIDLIPEGKIHLLTTIENGLGLRMELDYESSTVQMVRAEAAGNPWSTVMPIDVTVLARISEDDGLGHVFTQRFTYRDPHYNPIKQEFRGFHGAEAREEGDASIGGKRIELVFDTGIEDDCLKGKQLSEEVLGDAGEVFSRSQTTWTPRVLADGIDGRQVCVAQPTVVNQFVHEGQPDGIQLRQETDFDEFGNSINERNFGILDQPGDELFVNRVFEPRPDAWLLRLVKSAKRTDGTGKVLDDQRFFHDAAGDLEHIEAWLDTENRFIPTLRQRLDAFGNVIESMDARGNKRTIGFDSLLHAVPLVETIHVAGNDLSLSVEYDLGLGVVTRATDFHGRQLEYLYDPLGRLVEMQRPGGAGDLYEYQFGNPVSRVIKHLRLDTQGATFDSYFYSDCYARALGTKIQSEDAKWRAVEWKTYNSRKIEERAWLPFSSDTPEYAAPDLAFPHEARKFDALARLIETRKPDGSIVRQVHGPLSVSVFDGNDTAGGGQPDIRRTDGLGRIVSVEEHNGAESYVTRYSWNPTGHLERVLDALGNSRRFRFDSFGRLVEANDPDRGIRQTFYDDNGNVVRRKDARGQTTLYSYDEANRILERDYVGRLEGGQDVVDATYHYDAPAGTLDFGDGTQGIARNVQGRLAWVEDSTGEEHISYDERGNIEWVLKRLRDARTGILIPYRTQQGYDLLNRETETIFPDNDRIRMIRGIGGFVSRIDGGPQGKVLLEEADYLPGGQPLLLVFGNGARSELEYDESQRLKSWRVADSSGKELLDDAIGYDLTSNLISIEDRRSTADVPLDSPRRRSAQLEYDELHRLTRISYGANASLGRIDYSYDPLGNLLRQTTPAVGAPGHIADVAVNVGDCTYGGGRTGRDGRGATDPSGPHAMTATSNGHTLAYDASGNATKLDAAKLAYDFTDKLERFERDGTVAEYVHDYSMRRVVKRVTRNGAPTETHYVDEAFEVVDGAATKYAFLDNHRIARIDQMLDPTRETVQRIVLAAGWNLIAATVEGTAKLRDVFGADAAIYQSSGATYTPVDSALAVPFARALWVHAPSARLAVLRGSVPAASTRISAGPLHAWPGLQPFQPGVHVDGASALLFFDVGSRRWLRRDASLPSFLNNAPAELGSGRAFWSQTVVEIRESAAESESIVFYHLDHLGSPAVVTNRDGKLVEERAHYPYGAIRSQFRGQDALDASSGSVARWEFTGKERDRESGLVSMGARAYLDLAGVFLSPDPRYADVALLASEDATDNASFTAFISNPQMGNLYAYAMRNPLKFVDPTGLDVVFSKALRESPVFQEALTLFKSTKEGQRLIAHLEKTGAKVTLSAGRPASVNPKNGKYGEVLGQAHLNTTKIDASVDINLVLHKKTFADKDKLIFELADTIHHELRHVEGNIALKELAIVRRNLDALGETAKVMKLPRHTDDPRLRMGDEVHKGLDVNSDDPYNQEFRKQAVTQQVKMQLRSHSDPSMRAVADKIPD